MKSITFKPFLCLTSYLVATYFVVVVMSIVSVILHFVAWHLFPAANYASEMLAGDVSVLFTVLSQILFFVGLLVWIYRLNTRLSNIYYNKLEFDSGMAVASFFIPILNFYWPYKVMLQLWQVPTAVINNQLDFHLEERPNFIFSWYMIFLFTWAVSWFSIFHQHYFQVVNEAAILELFVRVSAVLLFTFYLIIVFRVNKQFNLAKQKVLSTIGEQPIASK